MPCVAQHRRQATGDRRQATGRPADWQTGTRVDWQAMRDLFPVRRSPSAETSPAVTQRRDPADGYMELVRGACCGSRVVTREWADFARWGCHAA